MDNKLKKTIPLALAAALGFAPVLQVAHAQTAPTAQVGGALSQSGATKVAQELRLSLSEAIAQGLIAPGASQGTYVVTQAGAKAVLAAKGVAAGAAAGGASIAGLSALQITALVAGVVGAAVVADSDEDAPRAPGTVTPTPTATPTPPPTVTPSPTSGTPTTASTATSTGTSGSATGTTR